MQRKNQKAAMKNLLDKEFDHNRVFGQQHPFW